MAGEAKTSEFLLSQATLMVGPSSKVMELNPTDHSLGLIKNVQVTTEPQFVELTQGVEAQTIFSVNTANPSRISGEVYEFTARNMAYGAGIDGSTAAYDPIVTSYALNTAITTGGTSVALVSGGTDFVAGDYLVIQDTSTGDRVHVGKVASVATNTITLATGYSMPSTMTFAVATTTIFRVRNIKVGANLFRPTFGVKLVGTMPATGEPVTLIFPKVKITRGLTVAFQGDNFANMPFEFQPYALLPADSYYADLGGSKTFMLLKR